MALDIKDNNVLSILIESTQKLLAKNSNFVFIEGLDDHRSKKTLNNLSNLPSNKDLVTFREDLPILLKDYQLTETEKQLILLHVFSIGKFYVFEIWHKAGMSLMETDFKRVIEQAINVARFYEYTSPGNPNLLAIPVFEYLNSTKKNICSEATLYKETYRKNCKRKGGNQTQVINSSTQLSFATIVHILKSKDIPNNTMGSITTDSANLHNTLFHQMKKYSPKTIENYYHKFKTNF